MQSLKKGLHFWNLHILINGIVVHSLSEPINIDDIMLENMVIEGTVEVSIMLQEVDICRPDEIGCDDYDRDH